MLQVCKISSHQFLAPLSPNDSIAHWKIDSRRLYSPNILANKARGEFAENSVGRNTNSRSVSRHVNIDVFPLAFLTGRRIYRARARQLPNESVETSD